MLSPTEEVLAFRIECLLGLKPERYWLAKGAVQTQLLIHQPDPRHGLAILLNPAVDPRAS